MFRRRRPLMRAALVGGTAYAVGKHVQAGKEQDAGQAPPESPDDQSPDDQQDAQPPASAPPPGAIGDAAIVELHQLAELKKTGALTQDEFDEQKRRLLQGGGGGVE